MAERADGRGARRFAAAISIALALAGPAPAEELDPAGDGDSRSAWTAVPGMAFDLIVVRPLNLTSIPVGFLCFLPSALFAEPPAVSEAGSKRWRATLDNAWQVFVMDAVESTFFTPLGEFEEEY